MSVPSEIDVAIVGAGAAGLAAARTLERSHLSVIVLEARNRLGGRSHTTILQNDIVFDVGCEWLHSADKNAFVPIARSRKAKVGRRANVTVLTCARSCRTCV